MLENTSRNRKLLAGIAGVNLCLALAVSAGALPLPGGDGGRSSETVASASIAQGPGAEVGAPVDVAAEVVDVTTTAVAPTASAPTTAAPKAATTAPPTTKKATATTLATVPPVTAPPVTAPAVVARRVPSAAEVQQALAVLPRYVRSIISPSPAQVAQLGDKVCTMFDQGQTFAQVKAAGLQMVTQVPLTTVMPGGADWVVRTAVALYCPGHAPKLV